MEQRKGVITQVIGPVLDIQFEAEHMPELRNAIEIKIGDRKVVAEVAQHTGDDVVRCIAMSSTDGLERGAEALDTGGPITVPVGDETLGRLFNLLGETIDNKGPCKANVNSGTVAVMVRPASQKSEVSVNRRITIVIMGIPSL